MTDSEQTPLIEDLQRRLDMLRAETTSSFCASQNALLRFSYRLMQITFDYLEDMMHEIEEARRANNRTN